MPVCLLTNQGPVNKLATNVHFQSCLVYFPFGNTHAEGLFFIRKEQDCAGENPCYPGS